jgi:hypothetical protein
MMPILHAPGVMMPGQLGPMRRVSGLPSARCCACVAAAYPSTALASAGGDGPRGDVVMSRRASILLVGVVALASAACAACANEYHPEYHPESQYSYSQNVSYPTTIFQTTGHMAGSEPPAPGRAPVSFGRLDPSRVLILQSKHLDRPAQVVGVVDAHEEMGKQDGALHTLQAKAAQMGADAVVGVEFHHGEAQGEPTHLSGLAVKFLPAVPYPVD